VSRAVYRIALSEGTWETKPSKRTVQQLLRSIFPPPARNEWPPYRATLARLRFEEPGEDEMLAAEAVVRLRCWHNETVRDEIIMALLGEFQPEYESMVEVEVLE